MTIVLVPGFGTYKGQGWQLSPFIKWFKQDGFDVVRFENQNHGLGCIKETARRLSKMKVENPILVGHSMGGLVAKYTAMSSIILLPFVTISSPLKGSELTRLVGGFSESMRQMQPGSEFLEDIDFMSSGRELNIVSKYDLLVPPKNQVSKGGEVRKVNQTHLSVIFSREVYEIIREFVIRYK